MRKRALGRLMLWGALFAGGACGRSASSTGSNTNWLERCDMDSDCGSGSECWCGACTKSCAATNECESGAQCTTTAGHGCDVPSASGPKVCVQACVADDTCAGEGSGYSCLNGACLPLEVVSEVGGFGGGPSGGSSGTGPAGGGGGDAGTASGPDFPRGSLGVSGSHACVVSEGQVYCWGSNLYGQLGEPPAVDVVEPRLVAGVSDVTSVALASDHTCALTSSGDVYCWGFNDVGQVGGPSASEQTCPDYVLDRQGYYPCQPTPTRVADVANAQQLTVSPGRSCALVADGTAHCWGDVQAISELLDGIAWPLTSIALGKGGLCALSIAGMVCGPDFAPLAGLPSAIVGIRLFDATDVGAGTGCVLGENPIAVRGGDGTVSPYCFGDNSLGQLGNGDRAEFASAFRAIDEATDVALGGAHACALLTDRSVRCWGKNSSGQAGPVPLASPPCGYDTCETSPQEVVGLPPMQSIAAGGDRSCGFAVDGTLWCWGAEPTGLGAPERIAGPWEEHGDACGDLLGQAAQARKDAATLADHSCTVDSDCTMVSLARACDANCAWLSLSKTSAESTAADLAQIDDDYCPQALAAGCTLSNVSCPEPTTRAVCVDNSCALDDPEHSGCTDHCACAAVRYSQLSIWKDECSGFDLWPAIGLGCPACDHSALYVVVTNRGDTRFEGDAVVSFEQQPDTDFGAAELPDPVTVSLALDPGQVSEAIRIESKSYGVANLRVSADGDCNPLDDVNQVELPSPTNACDP